MPYWMTSDHGVFPVYDPGEVERFKTHGWTLLNEGPAPLKPESTPAPTPQPRKKKG